MASIADVFFGAFLDREGLRKDAVKAGDEAGLTLGTRMSKGIATTMKAGLGVVAGAAGIAVKGMVELDDVVAEYTADTGASADEAKRAGEAINAMSGRNIQPLREIGKTLGVVHTDLGLTGDAADTTAEQFLHFARVTKRDAAEEVKSFDDILDAYGKTAGDIPGIMDKLVASHQKYGGAIAEDEAALAAMAPQLKAFNLGIDDGIALLDLFKSSGLDAALVPKALNAALTKLNGRPLKDFIAELASIEDPTKRARLAIDVFGAKAGVQLANAIKPGMKSLDAFRITTEEATGATEKARDAIDGTFGNRVQLMLKNFSSKLVDIGKDWGPVLTGFAGLGSLVGALGLDTFIATFAKKMAQAGQAGGAALIDGVGTATGAAGTVIGNLIAKIVDPTEKLLGNPLRAAGAKAGAVWGVAFGAATNIASVLAGVFTKLPGVGFLRSAVLASAIKIGTVQGTAMGTAAGLAFSVAAVVGLAAAAPALAAMSQSLGKQVHDNFLKGSFLDDIGKQWRQLRQDAPWPLGQKDAPDWAKLGNDVAAGAQTTFSPLEVAAALAAQRTGERVGSELDSSVTKALVDAGIPADVAATLVAGANEVAAGAQTGLVDPITGAVKTVRDHVAPIAAAIPREIGLGLIAGQSAVDSAMQQLKDLMDKPISEARRLAHLSGLLHGKELARGLKSSDPLVRQAALEERQAIVDQMDKLRRASPSYGYRTGKAYADGLRSTYGYIHDAAVVAVRGARNVFQASSPPGPESPLHLIDVWGERTMGAWIDGVLGRARDAKAAGATVAGSLGAGLSRPLPDLAVNAPSVRGVTGTAAPLGSSVSQSVGTVTVNVDARGNPNAGAVGTAVKSAVHDAITSSFRDQRLRFVGGVRP